ncbi:uncharacterized protein N0V89_006629 [Didymosphaeria variabile]|uniref:RING-type domain-containing protein n=1 Tax=Didymosphaeria variabile TaxID=1932322 RepID=A0A9W8XJX8_9PLEO|nr:uncharacterized protein N0V89_006629 [Didymosphaeria variabile]KAJ4351290.1 hypothetical protein N0V89_006629 [Didymosphaeria variabile]
MSSSENNQNINFIDGLRISTSAEVIDDRYEAQDSARPHDTLEDIMNYTSAMEQDEDELGPVDTEIPAEFLVAFQAFSNPQHTVGQEGNQRLPTRAQFMNPENANGLLALSDPRTEARPTDVCAICHEAMDELDKAVVVVPCGHMFDRSCVMTWLDNPITTCGTCPLCRRNLFKDVPSQEASIENLLEEIDRLSERRNLSSNAEDRRMLGDWIEDAYEELGRRDYESFRLLAEGEEVSGISNGPNEAQLANFIAEWVDDEVLDRAGPEARLFRYTIEHIEQLSRRRAERTGGAPDAS